METEESVRIIATALNNVKKKISHIDKTGSNAHFKYDFVEEAHLISEVRSALIDQGLIMAPCVSQPVQVFTGQGSGGNQTTVVFVQEYSLSHISGAVWPHRIAVVAAGMDTGDKHVWKASTGASKYALMRLLQLSTGDDPEADGQVDEEHDTQRQPAPRARPSTPRPGPRQSVEDVLGRYDEEAKADSQLLKDVGLYRKAFSKAEELHGRPAIDDNDKLKFSVLDIALRRIGLDSPNQLKVKDIPPLLDIIADFKDDDFN